MSLLIPNTIEEFCHECRGILHYNARRWFRPHLPSTHEDYYQVAVMALIDAWESRPTDAEERRAWAWSVITRASQRLHRQDIRTARRCHELADGQSLERAAVASGPEAPEWLADQERIAAVREMASRLPAALRVVMDRLYGFDGKPAAGTLQQTAMDLGMGHREVAERVERAHTHLRGSLNDWHTL